MRCRSWGSLYLLAVLFRGSKPSSFCRCWDFSNDQLVVLKHFYFFVSVDFCCCYALVCILQCCLLPSSFVILVCRWISPIKPFAFTFLYKNKESFLKPRDVLTWYFSCSWALRFVVFVFLSFFPPISLYFCWWQCQVFFGCYRFLTRWCWVDEGSFDSCSMRFCFLYQRGWTDISPLQVYIYIHI